tara:strand:+ start:1350 stop:2294 length:945 start_codon:yes stop_codon:yes gene_type:complete
MAINLTNGESYVFGKINNTPVILESSDSANATKVVRNKLQVIVDADAIASECLYLHNDNTGTSADTFIHFEEGGGIDWSMGIDATDNTFQLNQGAFLQGALSDFIFLTGGKLRVQDRVAIGPQGSSDYTLQVVATDADDRYFLSFFNNQSAPGDANNGHGIVVKLGGATDGVSTSRHFVRFDNSHGSAYTQGTIRGLGESTRGAEFHSFSDGRYKHNVVKTQYGLDTLIKLDVVDYSSDPEMPANTTGFIAQDVYKHYPVGVHKPLPEDAGTEDDLWTMSYAKLTPLLVQSVQDLQEQVRDLQSEIKQLKGNNK